METRKRFDVVVVGAGAVGTSAAYLLAREGLSVCLVEGKEIGKGSSGHGHGAINLIGKAFVPGPHFLLGVAGGRYYPDYVAGVMEHSGMDPMFHEIPAIAYAINDEEEAILRTSFDYQRQHEPMEWASVKACREIEPRLTEDAIGGVIYRHGQVNGLLLTRASAKAMENCGGEMVYDTVVGLLRSGSRVTGVQLTNGTIDAGIVVLAMGAWSGQADKWVGFPVPVRPGHGEVLHYRVPGEPARAQINTARHGPIFPARDRRRRLPPGPLVAVCEKVADERCQQRSTADGVCRAGQQPEDLLVGASRSLQFPGQGRAAKGRTPDPDSQS